MFSELFIYDRQLGGVETVKDITKLRLPESQIPKLSKGVHQWITYGFHSILVLKFVTTVTASMEFVWSVRQNTFVKMIGATSWTCDMVNTLMQIGNYRLSHIYAYHVLIKR